jgi:two-component system, NtrC family, sensor histidine kinase KinB
MIRHLHVKFALAGCLLLSATVGFGVWSALTFSRLSRLVDTALQKNQEAINLAALLAGSLEREDDALLLALGGDREKADLELYRERRLGDQHYQRLLQLLPDGEEHQLVRALGEEIDRYRDAGSELLTNASKPSDLEHYHQRINPLLRQAVASCDRLRELNFRSMQEAGTRISAEARQARQIVTVDSILAVVLAGLVAAWLARAVVRPVRELTASVEAVGQGKFERRVPVESADELGQLAAGFNRMAVALGEYRRSSLGQVMAAKTTLEVTLNALPDPVLVIAPDGTLAATNPPARVVLEAKNAGAARHLQDLPFSTDQREAVQAALAGRRDPPHPPDFQKTMNVPLAGQSRRFLVTAVPIPEFITQQTGAVVVLDDVSEFARLDELRAELIGVASHELKSPLTTLRMNLLMLGEKAKDLPPAQQELLQAAVQGCEELGGTIEELLDVTRIEAGQLRLQMSPVDLAALFDQVRRGLQVRFDDASVRLQMESEGPILVLGDGPRLAAVFANLLTNALKYSPAGGTVMVRLASRQNALANGILGLQVTVTDQGPGIPEEFREQVFEKFFRVEHQTGNRGKTVRGTGIGLYLCREIIKAHQGAILCEAGENGIGTRIAFTLPPDR